MTLFAQPERLSCLLSGSSGQRQIVESQRFLAIARLMTHDWPDLCDAKRMTFFVVGLNHKTAPLELRERLAVGLTNLGERAAELKELEDLDEIVLLSTCNRVEVYAAWRRPALVSPSLLGSLCHELHDFRSYAYVHDGLNAVRHLFRVAAGMDSMVLGETEIVGQVKQAYETARAARLTGGTLNRVFQSAFKVVKEIRTRTGIGHGATSIGGAAVELAAKFFGHDLSSQSVMILGAGQIGEACVRHLAKRGVRSILVANRSFDRARQLATQFGGMAVRFDDRHAAMVGADIVVASTSCPNTLLRRADIEQAMAARKNRPLILIDISVPRNIEPGTHEIENVYLYNIDDLNAIVCANARTRQRELFLCHQIVGVHASTLMEKLSSAERGRRQAEPPVRAGWMPHPMAAVAG